MLYGDRIAVIDGFDIYKDFQDDTLFYYSPPPVPEIARFTDGPQAGQYVLRLATYRRDAQAGPSPDGVPDNGGFLDLDVDLAVDAETVKKLSGELQSRVGGQANLVPMPFVDGAVSLTLFGRKQGDDSPQPSMVRKVLGATKPSLYGNNRATFSAVLDQDGAEMMKQLLLGGGLIMALAQYDLSFEEMRPAYQLKITINYQSVYDALKEHFGAQFNLQSQNVNTSTSTQGTTTSAPTGPAGAGAGAGTAGAPTNQQVNNSVSGIMGRASYDQMMESLKSDRSVVVEETNFSTDPNAKTSLTSDQINTIIADLMGTMWFKPTLAPPALANSVINRPTTTSPAPPTLQPLSAAPPTGVTRTGTTTVVNPAPTTPAGGGGNAQNNQPAQPTQPQATQPTQPAQPPGTPGAPGTTTTTTTGGTSTVQGTQSNLQASFEVDITSISQQEKVTATYDLSRQAAVIRQIHPQGQLSFDIPPDQIGPYVLDLSLRDDFFLKMQVDVSTTAQWDQDGLSSIRIEFRYGPNVDGTFAYNDDVLLTKAAPTAQWKANAQRDQGNADGQPYVFWYEYRVTANYAPTVTLGDGSSVSTSAGAPGATADGWFRSLVRTLSIDPHDATTATPVHISAGSLRFDLVSQVQLTVSAGGASQEYVLTPASHDITAVIASPTFKTAGTILYKDDPSVRIDIPEVEWPAAQRLICVDEPEDQTLRVRVVCANPGGMYSRVSATVRYEDGDRTVTKDFDFTANGDKGDFAVRLSDPTKTGYSYTTTTVSTGGAVQTTDWTDAAGPVLVVGYPAADVVDVTVDSLQTFPAGKVLAVQVFLEYTDTANDLHWQSGGVFSAGKPSTLSWSFPIKDPAKKAYQYRLTAFMQPPATSQEIPWQTTSEAILVIPPFAG